MAVVGLTPTKWYNNDGLLVAFGRDEAVVTRGGEYGDVDNQGHVVSVVVDLTKLPTVASGDTQILADNVTIPNGAQVYRVDVTVTKATTGATATFDLGLVDQNRSTEIDFNGLLAAAAITGSAIGKVFGYEVSGSTDTEASGQGALLGTKITNTGLLVGKAGTANFTAGVVLIKVYYTIPLSADL